MYSERHALPKLQRTKTGLGPPQLFTEREVTTFEENDLQKVLQLHRTKSEPELYNTQLSSVERDVSMLDLPKVAKLQRFSSAPDKVNIPELKNYIANLSRILFRLSITETESWPSNNISIEKIRERIKKEKDSVIRVF